MEKNDKVAMMARDIEVMTYEIASLCIENTRLRNELAELRNELDLRHETIFHLTAKPESETRG